METLEFAPGVDHVRVDEDAWESIHVVGDVHGCLREFDLLLDRLGVTDDDLAVVVGDLVRKGPDDHVDWIADQPVAIGLGDALVVHGGVDPRTPLERQSVDDLQTARSLATGYDRPFWWDVHDGPYTVFFGHTPLAAPAVRGHAVGLDTGCVYGEELTAYSYRTGEFTAVEAAEAHERRAASKFVEPVRQDRLPVEA